MPVPVLSSYLARLEPLRAREGLAEIGNLGLAVGRLGADDARAVLADLKSAAAFRTPTERPRTAEGHAALAKGAGISVRRVPRAPGG